MEGGRIQKAERFVATQQISSKVVITLYFAAIPVSHAASLFNLKYSDTQMHPNTSISFRDEIF
jgi:hypothetical protein